VDRAVQLGRVALRAALPVDPERHAAFLQHGVRRRPAFALAEARHDDGQDRVERARHAVT
jgi:hypothetical protein